LGGNILLNTTNYYIESGTDNREKYIYDLAQHLTAASFGSDPILMKYKSTPHGVVVLKDVGEN